MNFETLCSPDVDMTISPCFAAWRTAVFVAVLTAGALTSVGCNLSDAGLSPYRPPDQYFAKLSLEHHAINLSTVAPYDTVTLRTIGTMGDGTVVPGEATYRVDGTGISITNGVLKATEPVAGATIYATMTYGVITRTDSAVVSVIAAAPDLLHDFGMQLSPGDSAKIASGLGKTIPLVRQANSGAVLSNLLVWIKSSDTTVAKITQSGNNLSVKAARPGRVVLSTSTFAFGTVWRDSLVFTAGWPSYFQMPLLDRFSPGSLTTAFDFAFKDITIGVGACVIWENLSATTDLDVQFEDPTSLTAPAGICGSRPVTSDGSGNIGAFRMIPWDGSAENYWVSFFSAYRSRAFPLHGVFRYRSTLHGTTGLIRVCDERNDTTCAPQRLGGWS